MEIIKDFDKVEAKGMEDFKGLPIGAYECVIIGGAPHTNPDSGKKTFKVAVDIASGEFKDYFKKRFDAKEHGGAPILGLTKTVIKAHGSSDAKAFSNSIRQAINCVDQNVVEIIAKEAEKMAEERRAAREAAEAAQQ